MDNGDVRGATKIHDVYRRGERLVNVEGLLDRVQVETYPALPERADDCARSRTKTVVVIPRAIKGDLERSSFALVIRHGMGVQAPVVVARYLLFRGADR